jgi:hypothetical protein
MKIFNGGLNSVTAPDLIHSSEAQELMNVDLYKGSLTSVRQPLYTTSIVYSYMYKFKDSWVSYPEETTFAEYNNTLYIAHHLGKMKYTKDGETFYDVGLDRPAVKPIVTEDNWIDEEAVKPPMGFTDKLPEITLTKGTGGNLNQGRHYYGIIFTKKDSDEIYRKKDMIELEYGETSVTIKADKFLGTTDTFSVYRKIGSNYYLVETTDTLTVVDKVKDITPNEAYQDELVYRFTFYDSATEKPTYEVQQEITDSNGNVRVFAFDVKFDPDENCCDEAVPLFIRFFPVENYDNKFYYKGRECGEYLYQPKSDGELLRRLPNGIYQYCYTYYDINTGTESPPSEFSDELEITNNGIRISVFKSPEPDVTHIRIYRMGGDLSDMTLLVELENKTQTYIDRIPDNEIGGNDILASEDWEKPEENLKYLVEYHNMLFACIGNRLRFSNEANPQAWSSYNYIDFPDDITGIMGYQRGLLVFTRRDTYFLNVENETAISKSKFLSNIGCISHFSIQAYKNDVIWAANDGLYSLKGNFTKNKIGTYFFTGVTSSGVFGETYLLGTKAGIFVVDFTEGTRFEWLNVVAEGMFVDYDGFYISQNSKLLKLFGSGALDTLVYKSPLLTGGDITKLKTFKDIYVQYDGDFKIAVYDERDRLILQVPITSNEIKLPQESRLRYAISFKITGVGTIHAVEFTVNWVREK